MPKYIILAQTQATANALMTFCGSLSGEIDRGHDILPDPIIIHSDSLNQDSFVRTYQSLADKICSITRLNEDFGSSEKVVIVVDSIRPSRLSAISEGSFWDHLIAMLILTFPEAQWFFGSFLGNPNEWNNKTQNLFFPQCTHDLLSFLTNQLSDSLFDHTGLRQWIKQKTNEDLTKLVIKSGKKGYQLPTRQKIAAVIDEEPEFAYLHAYTTYRYGFRTDLITSWRTMKNRFGKGRDPNDAHSYFLLLEDMRLGFPDKPVSIHLSRLNKRAEVCPLLDHFIDKSEWRFLITTGQMGSDRDLVDENAKYLEQKALGYGSVLYKPLGGMADLWEKMGLYDNLTESNRPGNAPEFIWPPEFDEEGIYEGHGSPGKLSLISHTLLWRANAVKKNASSILELIQGAVLVLEAAELLGGKTPSIALSAISLRYEFESRAECVFSGTGYHFNLEKKLNELDFEVASITRWFHENVRERSGLAAKVAILHNLVIIFNQSGRMEEEFKCLAMLRRFNRKLSRPKDFNPLAWLAHGLLFYGEWLLESFPRLIVLTAFWVLVFSVVVWLYYSTSFSNFADVTSNIILWFGGQPDTNKNDWTLEVFSWLVVITGIFHIGVLISYLYSLISRK